jgi:serine phosphatase RsbU (regulator of sigma subunit)
MAHTLRSVPAGLSAFLSKRFRAKSIRAQLTLGLTAALVPCLGIGFYVTQQYTRSRFLAQTEKRLLAESELISYGLSQWGLGVSRLVSSLTIAPALRSGRVDEIQTILERVAAEDPDRLWRFWSASEQPKLLASAGGKAITPAMKLAAERNQAGRAYFQAALRGVPTYEVVLSKTTGSACLNAAHPVYREASTPMSRFEEIDAVASRTHLMRQPMRTDLSGVLVLCIPLSSIGADTGLVELFNDGRIPLLEGNNRLDFLRDPSGFNSAIILVSNSGQLLFPDVKWTGGAVPMIDELKQSLIPGLYNLAHTVMQGKEGFAVVSSSVGNQRYLALTSKVDSAWSLILILNDRTLLAEVNKIGRIQALVGLATLVFALAIIAIRSRALSRPLSVAGSALQRISTGDFDVVLPPSADDEVGGLLRNVQITANRLKSYLGEVTSFAITQKQIDTAKSIQRDFLLTDLPDSPSYDVAAFSRPALEIGADWYDMVDIGDYAVVLVADVCDKGVPSALYMSVFRSLIRSKLLEHQQDLEAPTNAICAIRAAIEQTNNYMAANQNASMMFATVFLAAINKVTGAVDYLCAGHESPVLMRGGEVQMLDRVSGPAIGLFEGASYLSSSLQLQRGDTLVIYSDGLVDARDPSNEGWGHERLLALLAGIKPESSDKLLKTVVSVVDDYMAGSDQFDDLTVMVFKWLGG